MKKIIFPLVFLLSILIIATVFFSPINFYNAIIDTLYIWLMKVFPSLFTFYIISSALINFNILTKLNFIFFPIKKIFKINFETNTAFNIFILSIFNGNPSTILFINQNLEKYTITKDDANVLLKCASFVSPLFIISFFNNSISYILILSHYLSNFIYCSYLTRKNKSNIKKEKKEIFLLNINDFLISIKNYTPTLLMIANMMVVSCIIKFSLNNLFNVLEINNTFIKILFSFFELSTGLSDLLSLDIPKFFLIIISSFLISFGGFSIHLQVNASLNKNLKYSTYFLARIIQGFLSVFISLIIIILKKC